MSPTQPSDHPPNPLNLRVVCVAIPFDPSTDQILMVSSRKHPQLWILPKGGWEKGESLFDAARREAEEEAGILSPSSSASSTPPLLLTTTDAKTQYHFFPLPVSSLAETWLEAHERRREWVSYEEAMRRVGKWADLPAKKEKKGKKGEGDGEDGDGVEGRKERKRKMELQEGLEAWLAWRKSEAGEAM